MHRLIPSKQIYIPDRQGNTQLKKLLRNQISQKFRITNPTIRRGARKRVQNELIKNYPTPFLNKMRSQCFLTSLQK